MTISSNQQKFYDDCNKVRALWGVKTSTFEQINNAIACAFSSSLLPDIDEEKAKNTFDALLSEWTRWRARPFLLQSRKKVAASITRCPKGNHYYVRLFGEGVDIGEKFNTQEDAQRFLDHQIRKQEAEGRDVINTSI